MITNCFGILLGLNRVSERSINLRTGRIVVGDGGDDLGGSVELSFPIGGQIETGLVGYVVKMHRGSNRAVSELLNYSVLMNGRRRRS